MATNTNKPLSLLFITFLFSAQLLQGIETEGWLSQSSDQTQKQQQQISLEGRKMIGSTAPTCTYNECRGCKHKCIAEQVPVEGNDPLNSPYHYRCICHR
ncbi:EPIDERMAL PATTERNING FACTOR-like protein 9 [Prosopis cineraria]|uniref:EPIDERMAL PATTERNING FACTOR-like protein 9 n=1 Tax=Prosopis cineraria TaxID=364024 RepID=UPI00240EBFD2|nr:EPIDERMAL PATTERNING FACTOR-like protein 9 [Prosopis cineraria]